MFRQTVRDAIGGALQRFGLLTRFIIVGATLSLLIAAAIGSLIEARLTDLLLTQLAARAVDQVDHFGITNYLTPADFGAPYSEPSLDHLAARLDPLFAHMRDGGSGVIRLYLYAPDGTVLYSDQADKRGEKIELDESEHLMEALEGGVERELSDLEGPENAELRATYGQALEVYVPFRIGDQLVGVYEIYQELGPLRAVRPLVWGTVIGGFFVLLLGLLSVVWAAARLIRRQQAVLLHQAFHDALTQLPNRVLLLDRLTRALAREGSTQRTCVLYVDLDNFKYVNDSLGHELGDELLVGVAARLRRCVRPGDTIARPGGDEFIVLLEQVGSLEDALRVAERIADELRAPMIIRGEEVFTAASIGLATSASGHEPASVLLRQAEVAMYRAKANGKARCELFDRALGMRAMHRLALETDLRRAVERDELSVHYQPIVDLRTGRISELEALVRWQHPQRGLVSPAEFIPLAEETGLIVPIGQWVLAQACHDVSEWQRAHPSDSPLRLSVNLSPRQLEQPDLVLTVARTLRASGLAPGSLKLEITESVLMQDAPAGIATLGDLKKLGVALAIDDFGTGYSSLAYLNRFPVDTLKIDRSFVTDLGDDDEHQAVVRTIIAMAKALRLVVTAEGVESAPQAALLQALGCDQGQGFYFARPQAAEAVAELLASNAKQASLLSRSA